MALNSRMLSLKFLELLLIWVSRRTTCSMRTFGPVWTGKSLLHGLATPRLCGHLLPLLRRGRSYSLKEPNSSAYSRITNAELLSILLKYVISEFLTAYGHFALFKSSTFASSSLMPTSSHPLMSSLAIISPTNIKRPRLSTPSPRTGAHRGNGNDIRGHAMRLQTRRDPHRCLSPELQRRYKRFPAFWLAYLRYGRASVRALLLKSIRGSPITKVIFNGAIYVHPSSCAARRYLRFVQNENCYWRSTTYCIEWSAAINRDTQDFWLLHCSRNDSLAGCVPSFHLSQWDTNPLVFSLFHRNQITRLSGWQVPREQHTIPRSLHSWTSVPNGYYKLTSSKLLTVLGSFPILTSPRNMVTLSTTLPTSPHQPLSPESLTSSLLWCSNTVRIRVGAMMNERRSASMSLLVLLPINPVSERMQYRSSRFLGHHCLHCHLSPLRLCPPKLVWRLQIENSSIPALKNLCNIPVPFICYPLLKLSFFLGYYS